MTTEIHAWFTEGFAATDPSNSKVFLDELDG